MQEFLKSDLFIGIVAALWAVIEYVLGKTDLVKSGSVLELVLRGLIKLFEALGLKKKPSEGSES